MRLRFVFFLTLFLFLLISLKLADNFPIQASSDDLVINELMPYPASGEDEWLEFYNKSDSQAFDLTGMWLMVTQGTEPDYDYQQRIDLSGSVPRQGFLTFNFASDEYQLPDDGACISVFIGETSSIHSVKYGNGTCDDGVDAVDATEGGTIVVEQAKSINAKMTWEPDATPPNATFVLSDPSNLDNPPSRGWCDISDDQCFQISTLTSHLSSMGITSNLGQQTDLSRATNIYFDHATYGRISFGNEINFTDRDAMTWLGQLQSKMVISQGAIALDADLIQNLINTQATLVMRNITISNPTIRVTNTDGSAGDSSIVSGLSYDQTAHTLTFTAAHFTTFTAVQATSSSSSSSSPSSSNPGPPCCGDPSPSSISDLFEIQTTATTAKLFFTPISNTSDFYISFSQNSHAEEHGELVRLLREGVQSHTINYLKPNTTYYIKVRGQNGCMPGDWSSIMKFTTNNQTYYKYFSSKTSSKIIVTPTLVPNNNAVEPTPSPTESPQPTQSPTLSETEPQNSKKCFLWWCW